MAIPSLILPASRARYGARRRWSGHRTYWLGQSVFWGGFGVFIVASSLSEATRSGSAADAWLGGLGLVFCGLVLSHLLRVVLIVLRARVVSWWAFLGGLLPVNLLAGAGFYGLLMGLTLLFAPTELERPDASATLVEYFGTVGFFAALLWVWSGFYLGHCYYRGYREAAMDRLRLEAAVKEAELRTLKSQVNPHFLFNSLNTLRSMLPEELERPREAVTLLADLLRATLTIGDRATVAVSEELETVQSYLALERLRFEERLRVRAEVDPGALDAELPPFLLQTLVENAVKFGIGGRRTGGEVAYSVTCADGMLRLRVTNLGRLGTPSESTGLGLTNARARLEHLYGTAAALRLEELGGVVVASVSLPATKPAGVS